MDVTKTAPWTGGKNETLDVVLDGKVHLLQPREGYRFALDSLLLAGFTRVRDGDRVVDLGTGVGIIPLVLSVRGQRPKRIIGVEVQEALAGLAERNVCLNRREELIDIFQGDMRTFRSSASSGSFDVVVSNPPYYKISDGRVNPSLEKAIARHEITCTLSDVMETAATLLKQGGRCFIIFPAFRAISLLIELATVSLEPKRIRWVHPRRGEAANFVLIEAHRRRGEGVQVMAPLFVYDEYSHYTPEVKELCLHGILFNGQRN